MNKAHKPSKPQGNAAPQPKTLSRMDGFALTLILALSVYVMAALTPSSYGQALRKFGVEPVGLVFGSPRDVRSDEWAIWTPYMQAVVRNDFQRYNATSPYREDLRNVNALPILDWGLVFKPYFWPFFAAAPAYAYSFFFAFQIFCFLYGYRLLFRRLGLTDDLAIGGSLLLFFCGFTQYWWTTLGPTLSFFPWVVLALALPHRWWKYPLVSYAAVAWVFGLAYPPAIITLCFVALALGPLLSSGAHAAEGDLWRRFKGPLLSALSLAAALSLIWFYYRDLIAATLHTVYPGSRRIASGTGELALLAGMLWPSFNQQGFHAPGFPSICESGVAGSFLPLSVLAFADYRAMRKFFSRRRAAIVLSGLLMAAWVFLPVPAAIGKVFLWQFVPARRMMFALGFLMTLLCLLALEFCAPVFSKARAGFLFAIFAGGIAASKLFWRLPLPDVRAEEFAIFAAIPAGWYLASRRKLSPRRVIVYSCVVANVALFGFFNPLQSARDIFSPHDSKMLSSMREMQRNDPRGWLVAGGLPGAAPNGEGFRSIEHVLMSPQTEFFRPLFPELPDAEFNQIFNRYAHIHLDKVEAPFAPQADVIVLPATRLRAPRRSRQVIAASKPLDRAALRLDGRLDRVAAEGSRIQLTGWVPWPETPGQEKLYVLSDEALLVIEHSIRVRPDIAKALKDESMLFSGFDVRLERTNVESRARPPKVCVVSENSSGDRVALSNAADPSACLDAVGGVE